MTMADARRATNDAIAASVASSLDGEASSEAAGKGTPSGEATPTTNEETPNSTEVGSDVVTEAPQTLFGLDLSVLPDDEARATFVREFEETNKTIGKLQREKAEAIAAAEAARAANTPAAPELTVDVSQITDQQIGLAIGIDLENSMDPERDQREISLTRTLLEQEDRLAKMEAGYQKSSQQTTWNQSLGALVEKFGDLPGDTTVADVISWAGEQGITSPEAAYWAAVGPIKASAASALEQRLAALKTDGKKGASTPRPKGSAPVDENKLVSTNVRDGVKEAFEKARKALGIAEYTS